MLQGLNSNNARDAEANTFIIAALDTLHKEMLFMGCKDCTALLCVPTAESHGETDKRISWTGNGGA